MSPLRILLSSAACVAWLVTVSPVHAQNPQAAPPAAPQAAKPLVPLKLQIVLSRYDGDKKIESLPFTVSANAGDSGATLRMQTQVAVPNNVVTPPPPNAPTGQTVPAVTAFTYKSIGTEITCRATTLDDGRFSVRVDILDTSVLPGKQGEPGVGGLPSFQSFSSSNMLILKDGQNIQYAMATDPVSGNVTKVEASVTVIK